MELEKWRRKKVEWGFRSCRRSTSCRLGKLPNRMTAFKFSFFSDAYFHSVVQSLRSNRKYWIQFRMLARIEAQEVRSNVLSVANRDPNLRTVLEQLSTPRVSSVRFGSRLCKYHIEHNTYRFSLLCVLCLALHCITHIFAQTLSAIVSYSQRNQRHTMDNIRASHIIRFYPICVTCLPFRKRDYLIAMVRNTTWK